MTLGNSRERSHRVWRGKTVIRVPAAGDEVVQAELPPQVIEYDPDTDQLEYRSTEGIEAVALELDECLTVMFCREIIHLPVGFRLRNAREIIQAFFRAFAGADPPFLPDLIMFVHAWHGTAVDSDVSHRLLAFHFIEVPVTRGFLEACERLQ